MHLSQKLFLVIAVLLLLQSCTQKPVWYRGNTHAHTVICGHADSPPEVVAQWYHDQGYHFLILSEHNHFIDPDSVKLPDNARADFILIPGEEVSGPRIIHTTAMNIEHLVTRDPELEIKSEIIQNHVDITTAAGGRTILNHPNYRYAVSLEDVLPVKRLYLFELFNGHPAVANAGAADHISTEVLWDEMLTQGMTVFGVSSDDAHHFATLDSAHSNPGRGWVMVNAAELTPNAITETMNAGTFYASNGVMLKACGVTGGEYQISVDIEKTARELASTNIRGKLVSEAESGFKIEFIGSQGHILAEKTGRRASYKIDQATGYVRPRVTFFRPHPTGGQEAFYAWGQPVFTDNRTRKL